MHSATVSEKLLSPMVLHYARSKQRHTAHTILYRVGDFYDAFLEYAAALADICDIALTSKDASRLLVDRMPKAGVPHYAVELKLRMMLAKGASVAVSDQVGPVTPGPGLGERRITRILMPGRSRTLSSSRLGQWRSSSPWTRRTRLERSPSPWWKCLQASYVPAPSTPSPLLCTKACSTMLFASATSSNETDATDKATSGSVVRCAADEECRRRQQPTRLEREARDIDAATHLVRCILFRT